MTTAATLWLAAAMGIAAGAGQVVLIGLVIAITLLLMTVVKAIERALGRHRASSTEGGLQTPNRRGAIAEDKD